MTHKLVKNAKFVGLMNCSKGDENKTVSIVRMME